MVLFEPGPELGSSGEVSLTLTPEGGPAAQVRLHDDGIIPDAHAGDGTFTGGNWYPGGVATGVLTVGARSWPAAKYTSPIGEKLTRIFVSVDGEIVLLDAIDGGAGLAPIGADERAGLKKARPPAEDAGQGGPVPEGDGPDPTKRGPLPPGEAEGAQGKGPIGAAPAGAYAVAGRPASTRVVGESAGGATVGSPWAWGAFFGGGLLALGGAWWWSRRLAAAAPAPLASALARAPRPGLLAQSLPSLSDGLVRWVVPSADVDALLAPLLATLAQEGQVLVMAGPERVLPRVHGGAVFRMALSPAEDVAAALELLAEAAEEPVSLVILEPERTNLVALADALPVGTGAIALVPPAPAGGPLPQVEWTREGTRWIARHGAAVFRLEATAEGLCIAS